MAELERSWVKIDASRLAANFRAVQAAAGADAEVLAVVKADGYGHGAELCATVLAEAGARWFGVTDAAEGARVRAALERVGESETDILVMCGSLPEETAAMCAERLTPVVWTAKQMQGFAGLLPEKVHIEVDTGMGRQGARPGRELAALVESVRESGVAVEGLFTHLCCSEVAHSGKTEEQKRLFEAAVEQVCGAGLRPGYLHVSNSSGVDNALEVAGWLGGLCGRHGARGMVRTGLALYGYCLPIEQGDGDGLAEARLAPKLAPVLSWKARVLAVHELEPGQSVGYGATFTAERRMRVALLPVGYADGLRRELSQSRTKAGGGWVMTEDGRRCPVLGRISMNLTVVDVSEAPGIAAGDMVTVLGEGVTAEDHARLAGTIPYEILCGLRSLPHVVV